MRHFRSSRGFTLVEMIVVIVIAAILFTIAVGVYLKQQHDTSDKQAQQFLMEAFKSEMASYQDSTSTDFPSAASVVLTVQNNATGLTVTSGTSWTQAKNLAANSIVVDSNASDSGAGEVVMYAPGASGSVWMLTGNASGKDPTITLMSGSALTSVPTNASAPTIIGKAGIGVTLTTDRGSWVSPTAPSAYNYQWQRCNSSGSGCSSIVGATSQSYTVQAADDQSTLKVQVTATNGNGTSAAATSAATSVVAGSFGTLATNVSLPSVTGTAQTAHVLSTSNGTWNVTISSYSYQWYQCDTNGLNCSRLSGATSSTYTVQETDVGHTLRATVLAQDSNGFNSAQSAQTATVIDAVPVNTALPVVSGTAMDQQTLSTTTGTWSYQPTSYTYQWQYLNGATWTNISGATSSTYVIPYTTYIGKQLRVTVKATNTGGNATANSAATSADAGAPPVNTFAPLYSGTVKDGQTLTVITGTWTGTPTITYTYQWQYSTNGGSSYSNISGATASTYAIPYGTYTGDMIRIAVTGTNAYGNATAYSGGGTIAGATPVNTVASSFTGTAQDGQTLSGANGTWTGTPTITYTYQWQYSTNGTTWNSIGGATSINYTIATTYINDYLRLQVKGTNTYGNATNSSASSAQVASIPVSNSVAPSISGTAQDNQTLTASKGTWAGSPTISYTYQWQYSTNGGSTWTNIPAATGTTYQLPYGTYTGDVIRVQVTGTNSWTNATANSSATAAVTPAPPLNTALPVISGTPGPTFTLSESGDTWTGTPTISTSYQWQTSTDNATWSNISAQTASSYLLAASDYNNYIRVQVTAMNAAGSTTASSAGLQITHRVITIDGVNDDIDATGVISDTYTGTTDTLVPQGSFSVTVKMWGAGGHPGYCSGMSGGYTTGTVALTSGSSYTISVGGAGKTGTGTAFGGGAGGGSGSVSGYTTGGGGGYSGFFSTTTVSQANALLMAGGGGGSAAANVAASCGSGGGGSVGQGGNIVASGAGSTVTGAGGSQSSGGVAGTTSTSKGTAGSALTGGAGGLYAGGGGGGYYGGGGGSGGSGAAGGAGAGSGYCKAAAPVSGCTTTQSNGGAIANGSDPDRGSYGNTATDGVVIFR